MTSVPKAAMNVSTKPEGKNRMESGSEIYKEDTLPKVVDILRTTKRLR
jgi:hypothetical protein